MYAEGGKQAPDCAPSFSANAFTAHGAANRPSDALGSIRNLAVT